MFTLFSSSFDFPFDRFFEKTQQVATKAIFPVTAKLFGHHHFVDLFTDETVTSSIDILPFLNQLQLEWHYKSNLFDIS